MSKDNIGVGAATAAGIQGFFRGTREAEDRNTRQQRLTQESQMFDRQRQQISQQSQFQDLRMQQAQLNLQEQTRKIADSRTKEGLYRAFDTNTLTDFNQLINNDENLQTLLPGIESISKIDENIPGQVNQAKGMEEPILVTSVRDGKIVREVRDMEALKLRTGYSTYKQKRDLETTVTKQATFKSDLMNKALETNDSGEVMQAFMMTHPEKFIGGNGSQRRDSLAQAVEAFEKGHPNASDKEWESFYRDFTEKNLEGVGAVRETKDIKELNIAQEKAASTEPREFNEIKARNTENEIFAKLDEKKKKSVQEDIDKMKGNFHLANNLDRILTTTATKIDKDVIADSKTFVEKKLGIESAQSISNVDFNTRSGILLANFMKEMSGTAVADAEVARLRDILLGGDLTDETYIKSAIDSFSKELRDQNTELGSTLGDTAPYSVNKYNTRKSSKSAADFDNASDTGKKPSAADFD